MKNIIISTEISENWKYLTEREKANLAAAILNLQTTLPSFYHNAKFVIQWDAKDRESAFEEVTGNGKDRYPKRALYVREVTGKKVWVRNYSSNCKNPNAGKSVPIYKLGISKVSKLGSTDCVEWANV